MFDIIQWQEPFITGKFCWMLQYKPSTLTFLITSDTQFLSLTRSLYLAPSLSHTHSHIRYIKLSKAAVCHLASVGFTVYYCV